MILMIKELVKLNGDDRSVGCPECGELLDKCPVCETPFVAGESAYCVVGESGDQYHYHKKCFGVKKG